MKYKDFRLALLRTYDMAYAFKRAAPYLPDAFRHPNVFAGTLAAPTCVVFGVYRDTSVAGGAVWLSELEVGVHANVHICLWDKHLLGRPKDAAVVVRDIRDMFRLQRLQAFIPVSNRLACIYTEKLGFVLEGVLRKYTFYDGVLCDMALYSLLPED